VMDVLLRVLREPRGGRRKSNPRNEKNFACHEPTLCWGKLGAYTSGASF
jgi:hypothetical protein